MMKTKMKQMWLENDHLLLFQHLKKMIFVGCEILCLYLEVRRTVLGSPMYFGLQI